MYVVLGRKGVGDSNSTVRASEAESVHVAMMLTNKRDRDDMMDQHSVEILLAVLEVHAREPSVRPDAQFGKVKHCERNVFELLCLLLLWMRPPDHVRIIPDVGPCKFRVLALGSLMRLVEQDVDLPKHEDSVHNELPRLLFPLMHLFLVAKWALVYHAPFLNTKRYCIANVLEHELG